MLKTLVINYFERNNTFDGIMNTSLKNAIEKNCKETGESAVELLYRLLGYSGSASSVNLMKLRQSLLTPDEIEKNAPWIDKKAVMKTLNVTTQSSALKSNKRIDERLKLLGALVAEYYRKDCCNVIKDTDKKKTSLEYIPFGIWLERNSSLSYSRLVGMEEVKNCLVSFDVSSEKDPTVYQKVLYTNEPLSEKEQETIQKLAIENTTHSGTIVRKLSRMSLEDLIFLNSKNPVLFLQVMDYCIANDVSYAETLKEFRIKIPDLIKAYDSVGRAFIFHNDKIMYLNEDGSWGVTTPSIFSSLCASGEVAQFESVPVEPIVYQFINKNSGGTDELRCF